MKCTSEGKLHTNIIKLRKRSTIFNVLFFHFIFYWSHLTSFVSVSQHLLDYRWTTDSDICWARSKISIIIKILYVSLYIVFIISGFYIKIPMFIYRDIDTSVDCQRVACCGCKTRSVFLFTRILRFFDNEGTRSCIISHT